MELPNYINNGEKFPNYQSYFGKNVIANALEDFEQSKTFVDEGDMVTVFVGTESNKQVRYKGDKLVFLEPGIWFQARLNLKNY